MATLKKCSSCQEWLSKKSFYKNRATRDGLQNVCIDCRKPMNAAYFEMKYADPVYREEVSQRNKSGSLRRSLERYSMTHGQYEVLEAKGCAICNGPPTGRGRYHFDHDHETGTFRGLLCTSCNVAIGHFRDKPSLLHKAIRYLKASPLRVSSED